MNKMILDLFEEASLPLTFDTFTGYWYHRNDSTGDISIQLYPSTDARGLPFIVGAAYVSNREYSLDFPAHLWVEEFKDVPDLLVAGCAPF